jgi:hypothetical protein
MNRFIHQSFAVYLALILLLRMMAMPLSLLDYSMNKIFIADNLCDNRFKPDMHCSGKCYLNKQLAKSNDGQESPNQKASIKNLITDFFEPSNNSSIGCTDVLSVYTGQFLVQQVTSHFTDSIFHPPIT